MNNFEAFVRWIAEVCCRPVLCFVMLPAALVLTKAIITFGNFFG